MPAETTPSTGPSTGPSTIAGTTPAETSLGQRLRSARKAAGFSVEQAAARLGVLKSTWQAWEADRKEPRANRLTMTAGVLGVSPSWLLSGMGDGPWERRVSDDPAALLRDLRQAAREMAALNRKMREIATGLERLQADAPSA